MEWYYGNGIDDLVVPNDGGTDRLPSPESWSKWGISASECFQSPNKYFSMYPQFTKELNFSGSSLFENVEMETSINEKDLSSSSSVCEGYSEDSHQQATHSYNRASNQLEDLAGLEQMDDIFLSSLLDDLPGEENVHQSFYFSPDSSGMLPTDNVSENMSLESQSISSSVHSAGSSKYLKIHAFSPAVSSEKGQATTSQYIHCNSEQKDCPPVKAARAFTGEEGSMNGPTGEEISVEESVLHELEMVMTQAARVFTGEEGSMNGPTGEETSVEESVLHELEMVMTQLTEKTRICFRDALYRLANNSKENHATPSQDGDQAIEIESQSAWTAQDQTIRPGSKKETELKTNTIDRAIANFMFNEMDFNVQGLSGGPPLDSKQEVVGMTGQQTDKGYRPQLPNSHHLSVIPQDAEVPILGQRDMDMDIATDEIHLHFSPCDTSGKRKTPMMEFESTTGF